MYTKDDVVNSLKELGIEVTESMFEVEPSTSEKALLNFEQQFNINTDDIISKSQHIGIPKDILDKWEFTYYEFKTYGGEDSNINKIVG